MVSLMLSACSSSRNLSRLAQRAVATIEQARYGEPSATPLGQLAEIEAERDRQDFIIRDQFRWEGVRSTLAVVESDEQESHRSPLRTIGKVLLVSAVALVALLGALCAATECPSGDIGPSFE